MPPAEIYCKVLFVSLAAPTLLPLPSVASYCPRELARDGHCDQSAQLFLNLPQLLSGEHFSFIANLNMSLLPRHYDRLDYNEALAVHQKSCQDSIMTGATMTSHPVFVTDVKRSHS